MNRRGEVNAALCGLNAYLVVELTDDLDPRVSERAQYIDMPLIVYTACTFSLD